MIVHKSGMVWRSWQCASATMASSPSCVLAAISSVRPWSAGFRRSSSAMSIGGGGVSILRLPAAKRACGAQGLEAARERVVLRQHQREAAEQRSCDAQAAPPAPERSLGHAGVDQRQRDVARRTFEDEVRPDFGLGEDSEVRPPVVEETAHVLGSIERRILMHGAGSQTLGSQFCRCHGAGREQEGQPRSLLGQLRHQRQDGVGLADAGCVEPGERSLRPGRAGPAEAFQAPRRIFFAATLAQLEQQRDRRPCERCQRAVRLQAQAGLGTPAQCHARRGARWDRRSRACRPAPWRRSGNPRRPAGRLRDCLDRPCGARQLDRRWQSRGRTTAGSPSCGSSC